MLKIKHSSYIRANQPIITKNQITRIGHVLCEFCAQINAELNMHNAFISGALLPLPSTQLPVP